MLKRGANPHCSPAQALVGWFCRWTRCEKRGGRGDCLSWDASALFKQTLTRSKQSAFPASAFNPQPCYPHSRAHDAR